MNLNRRLWMFSLLAGLLTALPLRGQNSIAISCPSQAVSSASCSLSLSLGTGVKVDSVTFAVQVTPNGSAPALTSGALSFSTSIAGDFQSNGGTNNAISVFWQGLSPALSGSPGLGSVGMNLPASAAGGQTYSVGITGASASYQNNTVNLTVGGAATIAIPSPTIGLSPTSITFTAVQGGSSPASQNITVSNTGGGNLNWSASVNCSGSWLGLTTSGTGTNGGSITAIVTVGSLTASIYNCSIQVSAPGATNTPQSIAVTLTVTAPPATIGLSPTSLSFTATQGGSNPASQAVAVSNTGGGTLNWAASVTCSGSWLSLGQPTSGANSGSITAAVTLGNLTANTYNCSIQVSAAGATNTPQTVAVTLTVNPPSPAIGLSPISLTFTAVQGGSNPANKTVTVSNTGGGTLNWSASVSCSGSWLSLSSPTSGANSGTITAVVTLGNLTPNTYNCSIQVAAAGASNTPQPVAVTLTVTAQASGTCNPPSGPTTAGSFYSVTCTVTGGTAPYSWSVNPGLPAFLHLSASGGSATISGTLPASGSYSFTVTVSDSSAPPQTASVTLTVNVVASTIGLSPTSLTFTAVQGASNPPSQTVTVSNTGGGTLNWSASVTCSGTWLSLGTPTSGANSGSITAVVTLGNLTANTYNCSIQVSATGATNTPQSISVTLTVSAPPPTIGLSSTSLGFTAAQGGSSPPSQTVTIANTGGGTLNWSASVTCSGGWLSLSAPTSGANSGSITAVVTLGNLTPNTYNCSIQVSAPGATNTPQTVTVTLTVAVGMTVSCAPSGGPTLIGANYSASCATSGGTAPFTWSVSPALPAGLQLTSSAGSATISGTPTAAVNYSYTVTVTDSSSPRQTAFQTYSGSISQPPSVSTSPANLSFTYVTGGTNPPAQNLSISSSGSAVSFTIVPTTGSSEQWLSSAASGETPATVSVSVNPSGLAVGVYSGQLNINAFAASPSQVSVPVTLTITSPVTLSCKPQTGPTTVGVGYSATCTASAGTAPYIWAIKPGTLPTGISLTPSAATATIAGTPTTAGNFSYSVTVTDSSTPAVSAAQAYSGTINGPATPSSLTVAPTSLTFSARTSDTSPPPGQTVSVFCNTAAPFTVTATSTGNWLSVSPATGTTPASLAVTVSIAGLSAGTFSGQITVSSSAANPPSVNIPVSLNIAAVTPAQLNVSPTSVVLSAVQGGAVVGQQLVVSNPGGGTLNFTATSSGGTWLALTNTSGFATPSVAGSVAFTMNPQGLSPATYQGQIVVSSTDGTLSQTILVTLAVSGQSQSIVLTQTGFQFTAITQSAAPPTQSFSIVNGGTGAMNWTAAAQTVPAGLGWLSVTPTSGTTTAGSLTPSSVSITVNPQNLAPGTYYGLVQVAATGAGNSPQEVSVVIDVLASTSTPPPLVSSLGLLLIGPIGGTLPSSTTLTNLSSVATSYTSTASTLDGGNWLTVNPPSAAVPAGGTAQVGVQVNTVGLAAGVHSGTVRLAFPDGTVQTVAVVAVLQAATTASQESRGPKPAAACVPNGLAIVSSSLGAGFNVTASSAVPLQAQIADSCGNSVVGGAAHVQVTFSNKDSAFDMIPGNSTWSGTWTPAGTGTGVTVTVSAFLPVGQSLVAAQVALTGTVVAAGSGASAAPTYVANSASYQLPGEVSAGSWVSIFGDRLADSQQLAGSAPFPPDLAGTQVLLGETALPVLFVSANQVNVLIPYSLSSSTNHPLLIQRDNTSSVPYPVTQADVLPAIYSADATGTGLGAILIANTPYLAGPAGAYAGSMPVQQGQYVSIYCSGLGPVTNTPPDGAAAPSVPPFANTILTPSVTIGGVAAPTIQYSGLAPGLVGLYQINVQVPANAPTGDAVKVVVSVNGVASNTVTIAVSAAQ